MEKTIKDITNDDVNKIYTIIIGKKREAKRISRTPSGFILATFKTEKSTILEYDTVSMGITIDDELCVTHKWWWTSSKGTAIDNQPLWNHHKITKYMQDQGFKV